MPVVDHLGGAESGSAQLDVQLQIELSARRSERHWIFAIVDNGIGVPDARKETIFGIFKRLRPNSKYSGTGMGLAICKRIVERYRGRIWVESEPGCGARFFFRVPGWGQRPPRVARRYRGQPYGCLPGEAGDRRHYLDADLQLLNDGEAAIRLIARTEADETAPRPDLILLDINLPRTDGFEVLERLRQSKKCANIPVIVMTSSAAQADQDKAKGLGANAYFEKRSGYDDFLKIGAVIHGLLKKE
jgi:CheY-like chemotaxis protein